MTENTPFVTPKDTVQRILNHRDVTYYTQRELFSRGFECCGKKDGLFIEFGLYMGRTANVLADIFQDKLLFGFESFRGLERDVTGDVLKGMNTYAGELPLYHRNIRMVVGRIQESLPLFLSSYPNHLAYVNFDMDADSDKYALFTLAEAKRIKVGTIFIISHAIKVSPEGQVYDTIYQSFMEFVNKFNVKFTYFGFGDVHLGVRIEEDIL